VNVPTSPETLHVACCPSGGGSLREAVSVAGRRERVIDFPDRLSYGPIDPPEPEARLDWMVSVLGYLRVGWDGFPTEINDFWRLVCSSPARLVVWTSSRSSTEHADFLAWVERMDGQPYEVIDLADVIVPIRYKDGRERRDKAISLGTLHPETIVAEALWDLARPLSAIEQAAHQHTWRRLCAENAPLRIIGPDGLRSGPISAFDAPLLSYASDQWQRAIRLMGSVLAFEFPEYEQVTDDVLTARLVKLVEAGELEARRPNGAASDDRGYRHDMASLPIDTEVRLPQV